MLNEKLKQIRIIKELQYGSFSANMNSIGKAWSALLGLDTDIPGHIVASMYVAAKLIRTTQGHKDDNYDDAENYLHQARLMQQDKIDANTRMNNDLQKEKNGKNN